VERFGDRVRAIRREKGLRIADVSAVAGMTNDALLKIESGLRGKTLEKLPLLAKALGCRIDDLFPEMDEVKTASAGGFEKNELDELVI